MKSHRGESHFTASQSFDKNRIRTIRCGHTFSMKKRIEKPWSDVLFITGITIAVYLGMKYLLALVLPFLLAVLLAALLHPIVEKLNHKSKISRNILSFVTVSLSLLLVGIPLLLLGFKLVQELCNLIGGYRNWKGEVEDIWCLCCERIEEISGIDTASALKWGGAQTNSVMIRLQEKVVPFLMDCSLNGMKEIAGFFWKFLVMTVATVLILTDYPRLREQFLATTPGRLAARLGKSTMNAGGTYLKAQLIIWACVSTVCVAGLFLTGNRYALLAGIGIGFCDALPFLGTGTIFVPWLIIKLLQKEYLLAIVYGGLYIICNLIREFLEPKLVGKGLGIHPLAVVFSLYVGICVYGGAGILLGPFSALLIRELYRIWKEKEKTEQI